MLMLVRASTGEGWNDIMYLTMHKISYFCVFFWISFVVLVKFVMVNFFVLIILD